MGKGNNAVDIGLRFEEMVLKQLHTCGLEAWRTNQTNPFDSDKYKQGFDGGVDIIARFHDSTKGEKDFTFFIQCKNQKKDLEKTAIAEAYAGMHARKNIGGVCIAVVFSTSDASQETIQYAKDLDVELFLPAQVNVLKEAKTTGKVAYGNYSVLMKIFLYHYTKERIWIDTLPEITNNLSEVSMTERLLEESKIDFDSAQAYLDRAAVMERRANEERQKALDIQKMAVFRSIQASGILNTNKEKQTKKEKPALVEDSG